MRAPADFLAEMNNKKRFKILIKMQNSSSNLEIPKTILQKNKVEGLTAFSFVIYKKATV
jgi:hypothetical protein